jgi:hypothetical protein
MDTAASAARLADALREYDAAGFTGVLRVEGRPGAAVYLENGRIRGCETPSAPSLDVILLRSGRITEAGWDAAFTAAATAGQPLPAELVKRGLLGAGEAEALLRTALADAMFAVLSGQVDGWTQGPPAECPLPLVPPARPGWLIGETIRRGQVLASFAGPVITARDRVAMMPPAALGGRAGGRPGRRAGLNEILALADGRRTVRDLAFTLGRGLYETTLELARMRAAGLVTVSPYGTETAPRYGLAGIASDSGGSDQTAAGLPRSRRDRQGKQRLGEASRRNLSAGIHLLRPPSAGRTAPGGTRDPAG